MKTKALKERKRTTPIRRTRDLAAKKDPKAGGWYDIVGPSVGSSTAANYGSTNTHVHGSSWQHNETLVAN
ncbi:MAG TPA: hypothetical protein VJ719_04100 [Chthoniobacterales bacterium]|nr:hypothetical protein [Chthoniobacterales bacterium]